MQSWFTRRTKAGWSGSFSRVLSINFSGVIIEFLICIGLYLFSQRPLLGYLKLYFTENHGPTCSLRSTLKIIFHMKTLQPTKDNEVTQLVARQSHTPAPSPHKSQWLTLIKDLVCAWHCPKCFMWFNSNHRHSNSKKWVVLKGKNGYRYWRIHLQTP